MDLQNNPKYGDICQYLTKQYWNLVNPMFSKDKEYPLMEAIIKYDKTNNIFKITPFRFDLMYKFTVSLCNCNNTR